MLVVATATATATEAAVRAHAEGQAAEARAMLSGVVVDSAGGAMAGVALTLINVAQGTQRETVTTRDGAFAFAMLAPGRYTLRADPVNFAPAEIRDLDLDEGIRTTVTVTLQIAGMRETVAVRGRLSSFPSATAAVGTIIGRQSIDRLPTNGRSVQSLIASMPGIVNTSGITDATGDFSVNGQRSSANYSMVDGVGANIANAVNAPSRPSQASGGALPGVTTLGTTASLAPYEALEEVRLQTSSYTAEYGRQPGAQVSLVTRAGDSTWRGSLFTQIRNDALNANDWFVNRAGKPKLPMRQQQFGGMIGGPLAWSGGREDHRTFFLIAHEHLRLRSPQPLVTTVPTLALREQAHPGVRPFLDAFPIPDGPSPTDAPAIDLVGDDDARYRVDTTSVRVDHRVSPALSLFGRLNVAPSTGEVWKQENLATRHRERLAANTLTVGATHRWRRTATDLRINVSANSGDVQEWQTDHLGAIPIPRAQLIPAGLDEVMSSAVVAFLVFTRFGSGPTPSLTLTSTSTEQHQINMVGTTTVELERHRLKFGLDVRQLTTRLRPRNYDLSFEFVGVSNVSAGETTQARLSAQPTELWPRFANLSMFAQDTWIASSRLTLDVGLRWELNPPPGEAHDRLPYTAVDPTAEPFEIAPSGTPLWRTGYRNIAPRFGAAWLLTRTPGHETMLRGGGGVFYDLGNTQATRGYEGYRYRISRGLALSFPFDASTLLASALPAEASPEPLFAFDPDLKLPYTRQWNVSVEQALGATRSLTVSYVGAVGRRQLAQLRRELGAQLRFLSLPSLYVTTNDGASAYHALQSQFELRLSSRFRMSVAHTWSHAIDLTSVESRAEAASTMARADADFDVRHIFTGGFGYDIPSVTRLPLGRALLDNWSVDGRVLIQSGRPLNVIAQNRFDIQGREYTVWALRVDGVPLYVDTAAAPDGRRLNSQAFQSIVNGHGEVARNLVRGPGAWQVDLSLRRAFTLAGPARLTLQVNAFNALNHPNFGSVDQRLGSPTFGEALTMLGRALGGLNPSYQMGGPRTLELSLRLSL